MNLNIRSQFTALSRSYNNSPLVFLDGPAGTQVPDRVIDKMGHYLKHSNANKKGHFITSHETDETVTWARSQCAALVNAEGPHCISFGANMTSLAFSLARAFARRFEPGDEVVITQLDHEANRGPWLTLEEKGVVLKEIALLPNGRLDYDDAAEKINEKTVLVCAGWASNIFGTINDLKTLRKLSTAAGAWLLVDAVHYAPHFAMDVQSIACDFLLCSAYKFYGPHIGILYSRPGLLDSLDTDRLRTAPQKAPGRIESGTQFHAALAGVGEAIDFMASPGEGNATRSRLLSAFSKIHPFEHELAKRLWGGLSDLRGVTMYGPDFDGEQRSPTIAFTIEGHHPTDICKFLGKNGICAWDGHFYAIRSTEVLGLLEKGGVVRMGIVVYNSEQEIDRTIQTVAKYIDQQ